MKINSLLDELFSAEMFDKVKKNIITMKQDEEIILDEKFFSQLPTKYAIIFATLIQKYYENSLMVKLKDGKNITLVTENEVEGFINYLTKDDKKKEQKDYGNLLSRYNTELSDYNERVFNRWLLLNMFIKTTQQISINQYQKHKWANYLSHNIR